MPTAAEKKKRGGVVRTRTKVINGQRYIVTVYRKAGKQGGHTTMHKAKGTSRATK
jgi:hypothetical protein